jgi:hypothetical protein
MLKKVRFLQVHFNWLLGKFDVKTIVAKILILNRELYDYLNFIRIN